MWRRQQRLWHRVLWHQQQRSSTPQLAAATAAARSAWAATDMVAAVVVQVVILTAVARPEDKGLECENVYVSRWSSYACVSFVCQMHGAWECRAIEENRARIR